VGDSLESFWFCSLCFDSDEKKSKLDPKCRKLMFIGYKDQSKVYRLLHIDTNKIPLTGDVIVDGKSGIFH
jgi:hypothetical protein